MLKEIALNGPGERGTRLELLLLFKQKGLIAADEAREFAGLPGGVDVLELELTFEPEPSVLSDTELTRLEATLEQMRAGDFAEARTQLETLSERHPDDATLQYNLALCERFDEGLPDGEKRAHERLERLVQDHPSYLFARAQLAANATATGDLERARELLRLPDGLKRIHVQEYATFVSAQGQLALAEGDYEQAEQILEMLDELIGDEDASYLMLERALTREGRSGLLGSLRSLLDRG